MQTILINILLFLFCLLCIGTVALMVTGIIIDHKREKREEKREARDKEYHLERMKELLKK